MSRDKEQNKPPNKTINQGLTRKEELNRVRGFTTIIDPERGPENKKKINRK